MRTIDEQAEIIRNAGYRLTKSRLAVLQVLAEVGSYADAATIYYLGRDILPHLGRVSVYRTLELLCELGLARKVHSPDGCHSFGRADSLEGHYLVCQQCGLITEFPCYGLDELLETVALQSGYTIRDHMLQLEGICPECQRKQISNTIHAITFINEQEIM
ncbi:MAG: transcriptional repressor [Anaerolineales bacterium]|nr:transcriptional repressor [Anaerolineales bacterium]